MMHPSIYILCALIILHLIRAQHQSIWHEPMDADPSSSWAGSVTPTFLSATNCPDPNDYCWAMIGDGSTSRDASTTSWTSVQLTYSAVVTGIIGGGKYCSIEYSTGGGFTEIQKLSTDTAASGITNTYTGWGNSADGVATLTIRLTFKGSTHSCYFNEFKLEGIHDGSATAPPSLIPTQIPSVSPIRPATFPPSKFPTKFPSASPNTQTPSNNPTQTPSITPTTPSIQPTTYPSTSPIIPTNSPSVIPTINPTKAPTNNPTKLPSTSPIIPTNSQRIVLVLSLPLIRPKHQQTIQPPTHQCLRLSHLSPRQIQ
eukprot:90676_1